MSKKDYVGIARLIRTQLDQLVGTPGETEARAAVALIAYGLCRIFADDNPRFSADLFMDACGLGS